MSDETEDDLDARIIARAAHLLTPPPSTPAQRIAALEAELARERAAWLDTMRRGNEALAEVCRERDRLQARVFKLEDEVAKQRARAELAEGEVSKLGSQSFAYRMRAYGAEARVRELEAERDRHEHRERKLEALGFEPPGPDAYTCGDALGLRRLDEVDEDPPDPEKTSPT